MKSAANESSKIKKARAKLQKQLEKEDSRITPEALKKMGHAIRTWISRNSRERIKLEDKTFRLFDENKHPAKTKSRFVREMASSLKLSKEKDEQSLAGRVRRES